MARNHARLSTAITRDPKWRALSLEAQWMYVTLLAQPKLNIAGCIDVKLGTWAQLTVGKTAGDIATYLTELEDHRFVAWDHDTDELVIRTFVKNDRVMQNRNSARGMWAAWAAIESGRLRQIVVDNLPPEAWKPEYEPPFERQEQHPENDRSNDRSDDRSDSRSNHHPVSTPSPVTDSHGCAVENPLRVPADRSELDVQRITRHIETTWHVDHDTARLFVVHAIDDNPHATDTQITALAELRFRTPA